MEDWKYCNRGVSSRLNLFWLVFDTTKNTIISPNFLVWKFYGKAQFPQFPQLLYISETIHFHKTSEPRNKMKLWYFFAVRGQINCYISFKLIVTLLNQLLQRWSVFKDLGKLKTIKARNMQFLSHEVQKSAKPFIIFCSLSDGF